MDESEQEVQKLIFFKGPKPRAESKRSTSGDTSATPTHEKVASLRALACVPVRLRVLRRVAAARRSLCFALPCCRRAVLPLCQRAALALGG